MHFDPLISFISRKVQNTNMKVFYFGYFQGTVSEQQTNPITSSTLTWEPHLWGFILYFKASWKCEKEFGVPNSHRLEDGMMSGLLTKENYIQKVWGKSNTL